jgi:hypothetical protein
VVPDYVAGHIIRNREPWDAAEVGEHPRVHADPVRKGLGPGQLGDVLGRATSPPYISSRSEVVIGA